MDAAPVLDLDHLHALSNGDRLLDRELIAAFESECHVYLARLSRALVQVDWDAIQAVAATLHRSCVAFGAVAMAHLLADIEQDYGHTHAPWKDWGARLDSAWRQLRFELRRIQFESTA